MASSPYTLLGNPIPGPTAQTVWIGDGTNSLELDVCVKETHKAQVEVTDHAVEQGIAVSDHARPKPREVTIEGMITNSPTTTGALPGRADSARSFMFDLWKTPKICSLWFAGQSYTNNMMLTELTEEREAKTGDVFQFSATFKQLRQVQNLTTQVATKQPKAQKKAASGGATTTPINGGPQHVAAVKALGMSPPAPR
jgi:hypothetical protein